MSHRPAALSAILLLLATILPACTAGPDWDRRIGAQTAEQVRDEMGVLRDPQLEAYVASVGRRLTDQLEGSPFQYSFTLVDEETPNAFAAPGGYIFVTRGLLAGLNSEDELACILGHEIVHVHERHTARQYERAVLPSVLALPGRTVGVVLPRVGNVLASPFEGIGRIALASYSRKQEHEADRLGLQLAARAGYDPAGLPDFLHTMQRYEKLIGADQPDQKLLASHPLTPDRLNDTRQLATQTARAERAPIAPDRNAFLARLDGLTVGPNPAEGIFIDNQFTHPDAGIAITFPRGWHHLNARHAVAALSPSQNALIYYPAPTPGSNPDVLATQFLRDLREAGVEPDVNRTLTINQLPARAIGAYAGQADGVDYYLDVTFIAARDRTFRQVALTPRDQRAVADITARSFRTLSDAERRSVTVRRLRIARATPGETLDTLSARTGNVLSLEATAIINSLQPTQKLTEGQPIKIATAEPYTPQPWQPPH